MLKTALKRKPRKSRCTSECAAVVSASPKDCDTASHAPRTAHSDKLRLLYYDVLPDALMLEDLRSRNFEPTLILSMPRNDERDHRNFLFALSQGMSDGTIAVSKDRIHAAELDMRAHGMLSKYGPKDMAESKKRQSIENMLTDWSKGRHSLGQSTIVDPERVERLLREKSGIGHLQESKKTGKLLHKWKRKNKGSSE